MGVTKVLCGDLTVAQVLVDNGISVLADSKLDNLKKMRDAGIQAQFALLRTPALSEVEAVIQYADMSMNTELKVIQQLSIVAHKYRTVHKIILMLEMGDLREGIMPIDVEEFVREVLKLRGVQLIGIGANFSCFGGVIPSEEKMQSLSSIANAIETQFSLPLAYVSGGNSANFSWLENTKNFGKINNLRLGESIFLGRETLLRTPIPGLFTDAFEFVSEVIEAKVKPSVPYGEIGQDAFGNIPHFQDLGSMKRAIVAVGLQDVLVTGLEPKLEIKILGSSSDHTVLDVTHADLNVGDEVSFRLNYGALLSLMTSPYVSRKYMDALSNSRPTVKKFPEPFNPSRTAV